MAQPGWYPDPAGGPEKRYFDGQQWHDEILTTAPAAVGLATQPAQLPKKRNAYLWAGGLLPIVVLVALVGASCAGRGDRGSSTANSSTSRSSSAAPSASSSPTPQSDADRYYALLQKWATRDGYPVGDRDEMIKYGNIACVEMAQDPTLGTIGAGAKLTDEYNLPGKQAGAIAGAADDVLCLKESRISTTAAPTSMVKSESGALQGTHSVLLDIDMPGRAYGDSNVNDFNNDGKPNRFETWEVPLSYDATTAALKQALQPYASPLDGIPWEEGNSSGSAATQDRYVDWWWGRNDQPLILVRIEETSDGDGAYVKGVRTDVRIERRE